MKKPWERRLMDLSRLLSNCATTYFDPDLFRMNTNSFLQTARTVTFIIQKNKDSIPGFGEWYESTVQAPWSRDEIMVWAKDSRNKIEKHGDLEIYSSLSAQLVFSYFEEQDRTLECGQPELLTAGIKKLVRLAQKGLPSGISDAAAVKIERSWITVSLPKWELLHALNYVYARQYDCCAELGHFIGSPIDTEIPKPSMMSGERERARHVCYVKLHDLNCHRITTEALAVDPSFQPPANLRTAVESMRSRRAACNSLQDAVDFYSEMAKATFEHYGDHVPMLFMFDAKWKVVDSVATEFGDQADKFLFWRVMAERVSSQKIHGIVWIAEAWIRDMSKNRFAAMRNMPIVGERLSVLGLDRDGNEERTIWSIVRASGTESAQLIPIAEGKMSDSAEMPLFFLVPIMRAMGLPDPEFVIS